MIESLRKTHTVLKNWGHERWLNVNDRYAYKRIYINAGHRTSLQYHEKKMETNYVISGTAKVLIGDEWFEVAQDDFFTIPPGIIHRIHAITDLVLQEVSTPEVLDVIRVEDDANRPSGHIEEEHVNGWLNAK